MDCGRAAMAIYRLQPALAIIVFLSSFRPTRCKMPAFGRWAMRVPSSLFGSLRQEQRFNRTLVACVLTAVLAPLIAPGAFGQSAPETPSGPLSTEPKKDIAPGKDAIKKYDVSRIGQRGIGRGFNLYSLRREHELGRNLAAEFDRKPRSLVIRQLTITLIGWLLKSRVIPTPTSLSPLRS